MVEDRWRGRLWAAVPHRVVEADAGQCVTWLPAGTVAAFASMRGLAAADGLSRAERKHQALATLRYRVREVPVAPDTLHVFTPGRWSRVDLGWAADGEFLGWYVNFELPPAPALTLSAVPVLTTMDLVLDRYVHPDGSTEWKDRDEFDRAVDDGLLDASLRPVLAAEADAVAADQVAARGAFDPRWQRFRPPSHWAAPHLPRPYRAGGELWFGAMP